MTLPQLLPIGRGVYAWIGAGGDSNAGAIETPNGLLIIDTQQHLALANQFRGALNRTVPQPIRAVINTHSHLDHVSGNVAFADVPIIAHENTRAEIEAGVSRVVDGDLVVDDWSNKLRLFFGKNIFELVPPDDPAWQWFRQRFASPNYDCIVIASPTETFSDRLHYHFAGEIVEMQYVGPAHTDGDILVHVKKEGIVFLSDLFFYDRFPWLGDCDLNGWIAVLDRVLKFDLRVVVPGHGAPATVAELARFRDLLKDIHRAVANAIKSGISEDAAMSEVGLPQYAGMPRYKEWMRFNVRAAYRYIKSRT